MPDGLSPQFFPISDPQDAEVLSLFRQWQEATGKANHALTDDEVDALSHAAADLECRLAATPAESMTGVMIHAFMLSMRAVEGTDLSGRGLRPARGDCYGPYGMLLTQRAAKGLITDVARFMPELEPLTANWLTAPFEGPEDNDDVPVSQARQVIAMPDHMVAEAVPGDESDALTECERRLVELAADRLPQYAWVKPFLVDASQPDAALIAARAEIEKCLAAADAVSMGPNEDSERIRALEPINALRELISQTRPASLARAAVKLWALATETVGIVDNDVEDRDLVSLQQVFDFVDAAAQAPTPDPIIALGEELDRLDTLVEAFAEIDGAKSDAASFGKVDIEDQIRALVPTSITGICRQLKLLAKWAEDFEWEVNFQRGAGRQYAHRPARAGRRCGMSADIVDLPMKRAARISNRRPGDRLMALGTRVRQLDDQIRSLRANRCALRRLWEEDCSRLLEGNTSGERVDLPAELIEAWPGLSDSVRRQILQTVRGFAEAENRTAVVERRRQAEQEFLALGFRKRLARALAADDYDIPRLLAAMRVELTRIPNIGKKALSEIDAYREKMRSSE
jgi:hypothetical protein